MFLVRHLVRIEGVACVQGGVDKIVEGTSMELIGSTPARHCEVCDPAELSRVVNGYDLQLLEIEHILDQIDGTIAYDAIKGFSYLVSALSGHAETPSTHVGL